MSTRKRYSARASDYNRARVRAISAAYEVLLNCARINRYMTDIYMDARVIKAIRTDTSWHYIIELDTDELSAKEMFIRGIMKIYGPVRVDFIKPGERDSYQGGVLG